ncbi:hypothetical protein Acsp03_58210 [Actinomadura sp. NBRC 104412]|nr:hypothetical protein Acsp03_58210 [Actinomadura sp. NBRC 104412]
MKLIDAAVPQDLDLHLVLDNHATHKTEQVKQWLIRHPSMAIAEYVADIVEGKRKA